MAIYYFSEVLTFWKTENTRGLHSYSAWFLPQSHLHNVLLADLSAVNHGQTCHGVMRAVDGSHARVIMCRALWGVCEDQTTATTQLLVELLLEGVAQQVKGKGVDAGVGEGQNTSHNTAYKVSQWGVHLSDKTDKEMCVFPSRQIKVLWVFTKIICNFCCNISPNPLPSSEVPYLRKNEFLFP